MQLLLRLRLFTIAHIVPLSASILLHLLCLLFFYLFSSWGGETQRTIVKPISAVLLPPPAIKEKKRVKVQKRAKKKSVKSSVATSTKRVANKSDNVNVSAKYTQYRDLIDQLDLDVDEKTAVEDDESTLLEKHKKLRQSVERSLANQVQLDKAATEQLIVRGLVAEITLLIQQRWKRPPDARNGMQVELRIHLAPNGKLRYTNIITSSGNARFDRSAEYAVKRVGQFPVPEEPAIYNKYFRAITIVFRPDDL